MIRTLTASAPACLTVTLLDAMVLARSAFHHSMNYRSVVVLGQARPVADPAELLVAVQPFTDTLIPARWDEVRGPTPTSLRARARLRCRSTRPPPKHAAAPGRRRGRSRPRRLGRPDPVGPRRRRTDPRREARGRHRGVGRRHKLEARPSLGRPSSSRSSMTCCTTSLSPEGKHLLRHRTRRRPQSGAEAANGHDRSRHPHLGCLRRGSCRSAHDARHDARGVSRARTRRPEVRLRDRGSPGRTALVLSTRRRGNGQRARAS